MKNETNLLRDSFHFSYLALLFTVKVVLTTEESNNNSCFSQQLSFTLNQTDSLLDVDLPKNVDFTWERVPSGNKFLIDAPDGLFITGETSSGKTTLKVSFAKPESSQLSDVVSLRVWDHIWLLPLALVAYFQTSNKIFWVALVTLVSISWVTSIEECSGIIVHVKVPMGFVSEICRNGDECVPTSCDLGSLYPESKSTGVRYSKVSASNKLSFSDDFCTLKKKGTTGING